MNWKYSIDLSYEWKQSKNKQISLSKLIDVIIKKLARLSVSIEKINESQEENEILQTIIEEFKIIKDDPGLNGNMFDVVMGYLYNWGDTKISSTESLCWIQTSY